MKVENFFSKLAANGHVPVAMGIFAAGSVIHWYKGLSGDYVAFTSAILTFLGAHAWTVTPDSPKEQDKK